MTPQRLIKECQLSGVQVNLAGNALTLKGAPDAVRIAANRLRPYKSEIVKYLVANNKSDTWGPFTPYVCSISVDLVHELHRLIAEYGKLFHLNEAVIQQIIATAKRQALSTVPGDVEFFKHAIQRTTP